MSVVLAGISDIDEGDLTINGEQALISINTGLNQQLTGLENINVKGALLGFNKKKISRNYRRCDRICRTWRFLVSAGKKNILVV